MAATPAVSLYADNTNVKLSWLYVLSKSVDASDSRTKIIIFFANAKKPQYKQM